jgi:hypothetical protein
MRGATKELNFFASGDRERGKANKQMENMKRLKEVASTD